MDYLAQLDRIDAGDRARDVFADILANVDARLAATESASAGLDDLKERIVSDGAELIDAVALPIIDRLRAAALDLGVILTADSVTATLVGTGTKTFVIAEADRLTFAPASTLAITAIDDPNASMFARKLSYDREAGALVVEVSSSQGSGAFASWRVTPGARADRASIIEATPPSGFSATTVQGLLTALAGAIGDNPTFAASMVTALAARYTTTQVDTLISGRAQKTDALTLLGGLSPANSKLVGFASASGAQLYSFGNAGLAALAAADAAALRTAAGLGAAATQAFEIGSWTPVPGFATNDGFAAQNVSASGSYLRIGGWLFFTANVSFDTAAYPGSGGPSGAFTISGLPFALASAVPATIGRISKALTPANHVDAFATVNSTGVAMMLRSLLANGSETTWSTGQVPGGVAGFQFMMSGSGKIA